MHKCRIYKNGVDGLTCKAGIETETQKSGYIFLPFSASVSLSIKCSVRFEMIDLFKVTSIVHGTKETLNNYTCLF